MRYKVSLKKSDEGYDEGYAVWCPGLPGCWSQGQTENEALDNIKDAIAIFLEAIDNINKDAGLTIQEFKQFSSRVYQPQKYYSLNNGCLKVSN